jgi:DNA-binding transcriptional ArsR family regulator
MGFEASFKALSDPTRREILSLLRKGALSAGDIGAHFPLTGASISHHLSVLRGAGLISDEKRGKFVYYELEMSVLDDVLSWIAALKGEKSHEQ